MAWIFIPYFVVLIMVGVTGLKLLFLVCRRPSESIAWQFSLRGLFVVISLFAVSSALIAHDTPALGIMWLFCSLGAFLGYFVKREHGAVCGVMIGFLLFNLVGIVYLVNVTLMSIR